MEEIKQNYTVAGYRTLIASAESLEELKLIDEQLIEDQQNRFIKAMDYLELRSNYILRFTRLTIEEQERLK